MNAIKRAIKTRGTRLAERNFLNGLSMTCFCAAFVVYALTDGFLVSRGVSSANVVVRLKYIFLFVALSASMLDMLRNKNINVFRAETNTLVFVWILFVSISIIQIMFSGIVGSNTIIALLELLLPIVSAYCILNTLSHRQISALVVCALFSSIVGYSAELAFRGVSISAVYESSYIDSYSPTESHYFAGMFTAICLYFGYFRSKKVLGLLALVFTILTFKRVSIIFAVMAFVLPAIIDKDKRLPKWTAPLFVLLFCLIVLTYYLFLTPSFSNLFESLFGESQYSFSMARSSLLSQLMNSGFTPYGYGSSIDYLNEDIEMDLIRIGFELGPLAVGCFIAGYWRITNCHLYSCFVMLYEFVTVIASHSLSGVFSWTIIFVLLGQIAACSYRQEDHTNIEST